MIIQANEGIICTNNSELWLKQDTVLFHKHHKLCNTFLQQVYISDSHKLSVIVLPCELHTVLPIAVSISLRLYYHCYQTRLMHMV
jgi:hypothetical protein